MAADYDPEKKRKLDLLVAKKVNPYPYTFGRTHKAQQVKDCYDALEGKEVSVAGRIMQMRSFGKLVFSTLDDVSGRIQVYASEADVGPEVLKSFETADLGDIIGVTGKVTKTKKGEISVAIKKWEMLAKSLRTLPEKFHGLEDTETRYRKRYLDLLMNPESRKIAIIRSKMVSAMRDYFDRNEFFEVETPILQPLYGGAAARPFITHHNALDTDLYLRIANELYLKRLIVGGLERVYEFSKDFRNEDIDSTHNPEFTQVEYYAAYWDYNSCMRFSEGILGHVVEKIHGTKKIQFRGKEISFEAPFAVVSLVGKILEKSGEDVLTWTTDAQAVEAAKKHGLDCKIPNRAHVIDALFDKYVQPELVQPTFLIDFPGFMCPLAKKKRGDERLAERFELFIGGGECGNSYSEINDPVFQRQKLEEQARELAGGDDEAMPLDEDFLESMEYGMPPTGGMGIGIDRLAIILTDSPSIKEVILFPSMRPLDSDRRNNEKAVPKAVAEQKQKEKGDAKAREKEPKKPAGNDKTAGGSKDKDEKPPAKLNTPGFAEDLDEMPSI
ncbi:MAG: lysine--tRNA ligase [Candidatus Micrarchaeia archaeon]